MNVLQTQSVYQCLPFLCWPGWLLHAQPGGGVRAKWMSVHTCTCVCVYAVYMYMYMCVYSVHVLHVCVTVSVCTV